MWSFGAVLFHLLCGHPPYMGRGDDRGAQMLRNIMTTEADYGLLRSAGVSEQAIDFIANLLNRDPKARPKESDCFKHPWLVDVPDEFDYMDVDGPQVDPRDTDLVALEEVDEEDLDASGLDINDLSSGDEDDFGGMEEAEEMLSSSDQVQAKRQRVTSQQDDDQQVVMAQQAPEQIRYPSLPRLDSYEVGPSIRLEGTQSGPRLFGEVPPSVLTRAGGVTNRLDGETLDLPEFKQPQNRDPSPSEWNSSFENISAFAFSLEPTSQTHNNLLSVGRHSDIGQTAPSLMGAESLVGQLNMESFSSHPPVSTDPNSENPTTPEAGPGDVSQKPAADEQNPKASGVRSPQSTPQVGDFTRRIDLDPHPSLSSQSSHGDNPGDSTKETPRPKGRQAPPGSETQLSIPDELARTIDEKTGEEIYSFLHTKSLSDLAVNQSPQRQGEPNPARGASQAAADSQCAAAPAGFVKPLTLLGKLTPLPGSIDDKPIRLEHRMTSWGRGTNTTIRYADPMDSRIPAYALEFTFWAPNNEARIAAGEDWTKMPDLITIISTKTSKCIWVNDVALRKETPTKDAYLFGKVYTGDIITVYRSKDQFLRYKCEFYLGRSNKTRAEAGEKKFAIEKARKPPPTGGTESDLNSKTTTTTMSTLGRAESDVEKNGSVEDGETGSFS
jgi:serine/threonine protein kinase